VHGFTFIFSWQRRTEQRMCQQFTDKTVNGQTDSSDILITELT